MASGTQFSSSDRKDLERRGITLVEAYNQLSLLESPPPPAVLSRACRVGDGIKVLKPDSWPELETVWDAAVTKLRVVKFVPASGAATRMFSFLNEAAGSCDHDSPGALEAAARSGNASARQVLELTQQLAALPFIGALAALAAERQIDLTDLKNRPIALGVLIAGDEGLNLGSTPKGLIPFHSYSREPRSSFEEHLYEAVGYVRGRNEVAALHFTVAAEHLEFFQEAARRIGKTVDAATGTRLGIEFSLQDPSTDTLAMTTEAGHEPLRSKAGRLVFRPAGHGALITNLGRLDADVVFIKNIDNVARAEHHSEAAAWKKRIGAHLLELRRKSFALLDGLERSSFRGDVGAAAQWVDEARSFCTEHLTLRLPASFPNKDLETQRGILIDKLDRPMRVCGVVANAGEPGGGPFWVADRLAGEQGQIVETSQIDLGSPDQAEILQSASHFNPVDLACALRDRHGRAYDLSRYADQTTSFVATKKRHGRPIRVLERPGLWNGAMAGWNTAFIEVPLSTFTPVKTILDLLRPAHQPPASTQD